MAEVAVAEVAGAAAGADVAEAPETTQVDEGQPVEGAESPAEPSPEGAEVPVVDDKPVITEDGRMVPAAFKELFKLPGNKPLKDAWFTSKAYQTEFPGGIKEAKALKQTFTEIGGSEGIQAIQQEVGDWQALDKQFMAGDPRFVDEIAAGSPEAFVKHMPQMLSKFGELAPEDYQRSMAGVLVSTFQNAGVPQALWKLEQCLQMGNADEAKKIIGEVSGWLGEFEKIAKAPAKSKESTPIDAREQAIAAKEAQLFNQSIQTDFEAHRSAAISKAIEPYLNGGKVEPEKADAFTDQVKARIRKTLDADEKYKQKFASYYQAGNKDDLLKFVKSNFDALLPKAVEAVHRIMPLTVTAKKAAVTVKPTAPGKPAPAGWAKIAAPPGVHDVDRSQTTNDMLFDKSAILKNGKKVFWGDKTPA